MAIPIGGEEVERALRPWLGTVFLSSNTFLGQMVERLREYAPYKQTLEEFRQSLESFILTSLKRHLGNDMSVMLDNYSTVRINLLDIEWMTDDMMGVLFDRLTLFSANYVKLNDYALRGGSLAAMRVLYQKYQDFFSPEELQFMVDVIRQAYPPHRYEAWLKPT